MIAIMLIAGRGTRLQPLTTYVPKCCLPVAGVPLLHIWFRKLEQVGVDELLLNPLCEHVSYIDACIFPGSPRFRIVIRSEKEPMGTARTLMRFVDRINNFLDKEDDFLVVYGDVLTDLNLTYLYEIHTHQKAIVTMQLYETANPQQKGVITLDDKGWVTEFQEKPENPKSNLAFSGVFFAKPELLSYIDENDVDLGTDVLPKVVADGKKCFAYHDPSTTYVRDIGTIPDYLACQTEWGQRDG